MDYRLRTTGAVVSEREAKRLINGIPGKGWENIAGVDPIFPGAVPSTNELQIVRRLPEPVLTAKGFYEWSYEVGDVREGMTPEQLTEFLNSLKAKRKESVTALRYEKEVNPFAWTRSDGTVFIIAKDRESQAKLDAERSAAKDGLRQVGDVWKCADATGQIVFVEFTNAEIVSIAEQARDKVSNAFKNERALHQQIDAATTPEEVLAVDIESGWPV